MHGILQILVQWGFFFEQNYFHFDRNMSKNFRYVGIKDRNFILSMIAEPTSV